MTDKIDQLNEIKAKVNILTNSEQYKQQLQDIKAYEKHWQKIWAKNKTFEANVSQDYKPGMKRKKFLGTFPYPYMNGRLHLGHMFSMTKTEYALGWHKINGYNALFPFGFHVTGQPICGAAKRLEQELEKYGNPPDYEKVRQEQLEKEEEEKKKEKVENLNVGEFKGKKTKAQQKSGGQLTYKILQDLGVPQSEIPSFVDPLKWVEYFPEQCKHDLEELGLRADWRRTFVTTDINPYYDAFIRWQFKKLQEIGLVTFGKRNVIWSPLDQQPCTDHDRLSGEGVKVYEYTVVLAQLLKDQDVNKNIYAKLPENEKDLTICLGCATLRPETMVGQTNIWIQPEQEYMIIKIDDKRALICGEHAAENLSYQGFNAGAALGQIIELGRVQGNELLNCLVRSPGAINPMVPVLPLFTIDMCKGTGVVSSVPSDSPDDYAALKDVKTNVNGVADKFKIKLSQIPDLIEIIEIPGIGRASAAKLCEEVGVKDQYDKEKLKALKEQCYTKGFYEGIMVAGEFAGKKVSECKNLCKERLLNSNEAIIFGEPESEVIARSGSKCVVAATEQFFLDYGSQKWKETAHEAAKNIEFYHPEVKNQFNAVIDWLDQWPLSRTFGLGSRLPGAEASLIESLSDSTIYNAYYTISDILQNGSLRGEAALLKKEYLTDDFFNYVFSLSEKKPENFPDDVKQLMDKARMEFEYFYPVDVRCSGKDLLTNHLAFFVFHHVAIWPERPDLWPRGIRINGHLQVNGQKMSKSLGNLILASDANKLYSADGVRTALADGGDGTDSGQFYEEIAAQAVSKLSILRSQLKELLEQVGGFLEQDEESGCPWIIKNSGNVVEDESSEAAVHGVFRSQVYNWAARVNKLFENCLFREGFVIFWAEWIKIKDLYIKTCTSLNFKPQRKLIRHFIWLIVRILSVICPHTAEQINAECLVGESTVNNYIGLYSEKAEFLDQERLDELCKENAIHLTAYNFMQQAITRLKMRLQDVTKPKKDGTIPPKPQTAVIYVATKGPEWREPLIAFLKDIYVNSGNQLPKSAVGDARKHALSNLGASESEAKAIMKVITDMVSLSKSEGLSAFEGAPIDELKLYETYRAQIATALVLKKVDVFRVGDGPVDAGKCGAAQPGRPIVFFDVQA